MRTIKSFDACVLGLPPAADPLPRPAPPVRAVGGIDADAALDLLVDGQIDDGGPALVV